MSVETMRVFMKRESDCFSFIGHIGEYGPCVEIISADLRASAPLGPYTRIKDFGSRVDRKWVSEWWIVCGKKKMICLDSLSNDGFDLLSESFGILIEHRRVAPESLKQRWWNTFWATDVFTELSGWSAKHSREVRSLAKVNNLEKNMPWIEWSRCEGLPLKNRVAIARSRTTPEIIRKRLSRDKSRAVRVAVAESTTDEILLLWMGKDESPLVRCAVAGNRRVSIGLLAAVLKDDKNATVRIHAKAALHKASGR